MDSNYPQNSTSKGTKTIYLIRHGQTDFNKLGIVQGCGVDSSLNETGQEQAELFYSAYGDVPFEFIFVSSLKRTHQTIQPFVSAKGYSPTIIQGLDEINWGTMEGVAPSEESTRQFQEIVAAWRAGELERAVDGGEAPIAMYRRQQNALRQIEQTETEQPMLICMHGRAMRSFLCLLTNHPLQNMDDFKHDNVCLYVLEKTAMEEYYTIKIRNSKTHLKR